MFKSFFKFTLGFLGIIAVSFLILSTLNYFDSKEEGEQQEIIANITEVFSF